MKLLTFAHRAEAQSFFSAFDFNPVEFFFDGLFLSEDFYLLITGEGLKAASEKTVSVLTRFSDSIDEVINMGVAGSLTIKLKKNDLVWVRSAYCASSDGVDFQSFKTQSGAAQADCLSVHERIFEFDKRVKLSSFAEIIDRELWSVASACSLFKKPFFSLKIISDDLNSNTPETTRIVKEESALFSKKLLVEFQRFLQGEIKGLLSPEPSLPFLHDHDFYFTSSQVRKLETLFHRLERLGKNLNSINIDEIKNASTIPKERARHLLESLNDQVQPIEKVPASRILSQELQEQGFIVVDFKMDERVRHFVVNKNWKELDEYFLEISRPKGPLNIFLSQFVEFHSLEHIIAIRSAPLDEEGIWHDDGSRLLGFSLSLNLEPEKIVGGDLYFKKKESTKFDLFPPQPYGKMIVFLSGVFGFEHKVSAVTQNTRINIAGWCW